MSLPLHRSRTSVSTRRPRHGMSGVSDFPKRLRLSQLIFCNVPGSGAARQSSARLKVARVAAWPFACYVLSSTSLCQDNGVPDVNNERALADELSRCRQRGIEGLDRVTHNTQRVESRLLDSLAQRYSAVTAPRLRDRIPRIKHLLRSALASYEEDGNTDDAQLLWDLFFGDAPDKVRRSAGELLDDAQRKWQEPNDARFRERRRAAYNAFASYLLDFVTASDDRVVTDANPVGADTQRSEIGSERVVAENYRPLFIDGRTLRTSKIEAVLRFALQNPGGEELTIVEHQRIIDEKGACWWGWFKAAHDDDHAPQIAQRLGGGCEVALWNRREGICYVARCEEVRVAHGTGMPSPDPSLTPAYYRSSRWPAWLKLTAISDSTIRDLVQRFGDLPATRPTIFWSPEPALEPIVIEAHGRAILHLSGLRFGRYHRWSTAAVRRSGLPTAQGAIDTVLEMHDIDPGSIGVVVICGNFVSEEPNEPAYDEALAFIEGLCAELPNVQPANVTIVPGADDFARPDDQAKSSQTLYRQFHKRLYGEEGLHISQLRRYAFTNFHINVLPVNTVNLLDLSERDEGMFGQGYDGQLNVMLRDQRRSGAARRRVINVVAAHHHLIPTLVKLPLAAEDVSIKGRQSPGIHDAREVLEKLAANRVRLFLHGHLHEPEFLIISSPDGWLTAVCGAGTAGAAEDWLRTKYRSNYENTIAIYDIEEHHVRGRAFSLAPYQARAMKEFRIPDQFPDQSVRNAE